MKRRDILILAIVLVASLALFLLRPRAMEGNAEAYLQMTVAGQTRELVALNEEREIRVEQANGDYNVVQIFNGGFRVIEANCYNQDCIRQGEVTTENIAGRPLTNEVICLPHKLVLSLVTKEEAAQEQQP
jgi:hypothetical protein